MASTFTLFPRLPCELRLQVWELALRPYSAHKGGINYISAIGKDDAAAAAADADTKPLFIPRLNSMEEMKVLFVCNRAQNGGSGDPSHKSACLWDSGLLTACRESRDVIMRRYKKYQQSTQLSPRMNDRGFQYEEPSIMDATDRDEDWYILFQRYKDIPCYTFPDWQLFCDDEQMRDEIVIVPFHFSCGFHGTKSVFALEFDASWTLNWPKNKFEIFDEASPRGYLARLLREYLQRREKCSIWLLDHKAPMWEPLELLETSGSIFYDMDRDYVESNYMSFEMSEFLQNLESLTSPWQSSPSSPFWYTDEDDERFNMDKYVKVLVPVCGK